MVRLTGNRLSAATVPLQSIGNQLVHPSTWPTGSGPRLHVSYVLPAGRGGPAGPTSHRPQAYCSFDPVSSPRPLWVPTQFVWSHLLCRGPAYHLQPQHSCRDCGQRRRGMHRPIPCDMAPAMTPPPSLSPTPSRILYPEYPSHCACHTCQPLATPKTGRPAHPLHSISLCHTKC